MIANIDRHTIVVRKARTDNMGFELNGQTVRKGTFEQLINFGGPLPIHKTLRAIR